MNQSLRRRSDAEPQVTSKIAVPLVRIAVRLKKAQQRQLQTHSGLSGGHKFLAFPFSIRPPPFPYTYSIRSKHSVPPRVSVRRLCR